MAPRLAQLVVVAVFCGICTVALVRILSSPFPVLDKGLVVIYMAVTLIMQLRFLRPRSRLVRGPLGYALLGVQALLAYLPLLQFDQSWVFMPGFLAGSCLLVLRSPQRWVIFSLIVASVGYIQYSLTQQVVDIVYTSVSTVNTGLIVYGLTRLAGFVAELHAAHNEIARLAVAQERLRVSRDLHDLLGYSISAIALKSELTHRLLTKNPERAKEEVADILDISRQALADVRSVASGYRELSLDEEAHAAASVLTAANVDVRLDLAFKDVPTQILTVLATVLREGVTNVLRHSKAEQCDISVKQLPGKIELEIVNDGVAEEAPEGESAGGSGISNLSGRVARLNGALTAGVCSDRRFRLQAEIPLPG